MRRLAGIVWFVLLLTFGTVSYAQEETENAWQTEIGQYLKLDEIQEGLQEFLSPEQFSFSETVRGFLDGSIPFSLDELRKLVTDVLLHEVAVQKKLMLQILAISFSCAVFSIFVKAFENSQIAEISFYAMYLLISVLLMQSFLALGDLVEETCGAIYGFMKLLLPAYLLVVVLSAGTVTALGFYEITVLAMNLLQIFIIRIVLPAVHFYLVLLILNQMSKEDYFSKFADLVRTAAAWGLKTMLGVVVGLQAVQCLVSPAVDALKNSALSRLAKAIPGLGTTIDAAAETVTGSAVIIKNAVGAAGILALLAICLLPVLKLAVCIGLLRLTGALMQPVSDKRLVESVSSVADGAALLLQTLFCSLSVFLISLAMITAAIRS